MRRREFIAGLGAAAAWPRVVRAQQSDRVRRLGWLLYGAQDSPMEQGRLDAVRKALQDLGWMEGRNLRVDIRFGGDVASLSAHAAELVSMVPDAIVAVSRAATRAAQLRTQTIPIVFIGAGDATGLVRNIARPEGNITGITNLFASVGSKWMELLKEAAPHITRTAILNDLEYSTGESQYLAPIEAAAKILGVRTTRIAFRNAAEIERAIDTFAAEPNGALIVGVTAALRGENFASINRLALRHRLPAIYASRLWPSVGGLMSYGPDNNELSRVGAFYIDRILRGAKPGELPVQYPTRFELAVNLKTAKAMGLEIPPLLLNRADEVIE